jgi:ABC-type bacteriocin/lantibiotic exporter with double-glycine peptidase domain
MYKVPGIHLIPQKKNMACWYASAQMLIQWKRHRINATLANHPDPSQSSVTHLWEVGNSGVTNPQIVELAQILGLRIIPPMTPTLGYIRKLLETYGPLWTTGKTHIIVIGGVDEHNAKLLIFDPWPPHKGRIEWRRFTHYVNGTGSDTQDKAADVQAIFLYHP